MADMQQADIVGNYLGNLYAAQDRVQKQQDAQFQKQRQITADDRASKQFDQQNQIGALTLAKARHDNLVNILGRATDEASFQQGIQQATLPVEQGGLGLPPEQLAGLSFAKDYQRLRQEAGVTGQELDMKIKEAQLAATRASTQHSLAATQALKDKPRGIPGGKAPSGYQYVIGEDGQLSQQFIPGGPADPAVKPLTDEQAKAAGFASRLRDADSRLATPEVSNAMLSGYDNTVADIPLGIGNAMVTNEYQIGDQARRDFLNAQLRRESGAVIGSGEFDSGNKQYFPNYGDKEAVLLNKKLSRKQAIYNMLVSAGPRYAKDAEDARKEYLTLRQQIINGTAGGEDKPGAANHIDEADKIVGLKK